MKKLVKVEWIDSTVTGGWEAKGVRRSLAYITTVGFLIYEDTSKVTITHSIEEGDGDTCGSITIPKLAIESMVPLAYEESDEE